VLLHSGIVDRRSEDLTVLQHLAAKVRE
jgi:hypothetical protein